MSVEIATSANLTVWGRVSSSNVQAVMWCLAELCVPVTRIDAGLHYGVVDTPEYKVMNPNATVPTLQDESGVVIWESAAILRYLAARFADNAFWPQDPAHRAGVDRWAEWAKLNVALKFTAPVFWRVVRTPASRRDPVAIATAVQALEAGSLTIAEHQLEKNDWLAGEHFSLADIQFGHTLFRYFNIDILRADLPGLRRYYDRLTQRSAFQEHVMVSWEELEDTL